MHELGKNRTRARGGLDGREARQQQRHGGAVAVEDLVRHEGLGHALGLQARQTDRQQDMKIIAVAKINGYDIYSVAESLY